MQPSVRPSSFCPRWSSPRTLLFCGLVAGWSLVLAATTTAQTAVVPGVPSLADMDAYVLARTPLLDVSLSTDSVGAAALHLVAEGGVFQPLTLLPAPLVRGGVSHTAGSTSAGNPQPVAKVTLTYAALGLEPLVWVQMAQPGGVLSATDSTGKVYSGEHGFFLTLGAAGQVTFTYQAPNVGSTYQLLTRFDNVTTVVRFRVPHPAP